MILPWSNLTKSSSVNSIFVSIVKRVLVCSKFMVISAICCKINVIFVSCQFKSQKASFKHVSWSDVVSILLQLLYFMTIKTGQNRYILPLLLDLSVLYVQRKRTTLSIFYKGAKCDFIYLWQVYAFLNQVLLQRFENFSLIANYSHLYELLFIGLEPRMLPSQQNFSHYFVCIDTFHLPGNFHLVLAYNT